MGASQAGGAYTRGKFRRASFRQQTPFPENRTGTQPLLNRWILAEKLNSSRDMARTMTRYFFHVRGADDLVSCDREGQELPDLEAARAEAVSSNREMLGERLLHGGRLGPRQIEIADESGNVLATISAEDVLMRNGQLRAFPDDVTKTAPSSSVAETGKKAPAE